MDDYVTLSEASTYLGVSKATLRKWDKEGKLRAVRHPINRYRVYSLGELRALKPQSWLPSMEPSPVAAKRQICDLRAARQVISSLHNILRDTDSHSSIIERFDELTKLLFLGLISEREDNGANAFASEEKDPQKYATRIKAEYERLAKSYFAVIPTRFAKLHCTDRAVWESGRLLSLVDLSSADFDIKGLTYEEVIRRTFEKGDNQQFFTPPDIVTFIIKLMKSFIRGVVGDPACGTGGFLVQVAKSGCRYSKLVGYEIDERLAWVTGINLILHGAHSFGIIHLLQGGTLGKGAEEHFNSLDVILTNPPFGSDYSDASVLQSYELGRGRAARRRGILFLERCHKLLRPGGTLAIILDEGVLNAASAQDVRQFLLKNFELLAIVSLPETAFMPYASVNASILLLKKASKPRPNLPCFFARAERVGRKPNGDEDIAYDEAGTASLNSDFPEILQAWDAHVRGKTTPALDLAYVASLHQDLEENQGLRLDFRFHHPSRSLSFELLKNCENNAIAITDLCDERNVLVVPSTELRDQIILYTGLANIEPENGTAHQVPTPSNSIKSAVKRYEPGDIVFARMRPNLRKVAWMNFREGGYVSPECIVLNIRRGTNGELILDPMLFSVLLRSDLVFGQIMHLIAGIGRPRLAVTDLRRVKIPIPSNEVQNKLKQQFESSLTGAKQLRARARSLVEEAEHIEQNAVRLLASSVVRS